MLNLTILLGLLLIFFFLLLAVAAGVGYLIYANRKSQSETKQKTPEEVSEQD